MTDFGSAVLDDDPIIPGEFAPKSTRVRESDTAVIKGKRAKPKPQKRSDLFYRLQAAILEIRPEFSCDWETTSEAILQNILVIEQDKARGIGHYPNGQAPPAAVNTQAQKDRDDKLLTAINGLANVVLKLDARLSKLEKRK